MKHHPDLFDAPSLKGDTHLLFKLKMLLGTVCAYGGEIPLSTSELAKRMGTSIYRINVLIKKLVVEGLVRMESGKLFLAKFKFIQEKDSYTEDDVYVRNFKFLTESELNNEERNVQRFVIHYVGLRVYMTGRFAPYTDISKLYGDGGLLAIRTPKEAMKIIEKASKYLHIRMTNDKASYQVTGIKSQWLQLGEYESEGATLWIKKQLKNHDLCPNAMIDSAIYQIAKVMEHYYATYGYEISTAVFKHALSMIQMNPNRSIRLLELLYNEQLSNNELNEIGAMFREIMMQAEIAYAGGLSTEADKLQLNKRNAEQTLSSNESVLVTVANHVIERSSERIKEIYRRLLDLQYAWRKRFGKEPEWFIKNEHQIMSLSAPIKEIKEDIVRWIKQESLRKPITI